MVAEMFQKSKRSIYVLHISVFTLFDFKFML